MPDLDAPDITTVLSGYGVTRNGFRRPSIETIWDTAVRIAEEQMGRRITSPSSAELQYIESIVVWVKQCFDSLEEVYYAAYYRHARGASLDYLLERSGFERLERREAEGEVTFYATGDEASEDIEIEAGTRVSTEDTADSQPIFFETTEPATLEEGEESVEQVPVVGLDPDHPDTALDLEDDQIGSATNVSAETITEIVDSVAGVSEVENPLPAGESGERDDETFYDFERGRDRETDYEFRRRYEAARANQGRATVDALESAIRLAGDGDIVRDVDIDEELTIQSDGSGGYTGRQIEPLVYFESDIPPNREAVSQAILETRAAGIESVGDVSETAERDDGTEYDTGLEFTVVDNAEIHIEAELTVTRSFSSEDTDQIEENLIERIGGTLNGDYQDGLGIGEDVYYSRVLGDILDDDIADWIDFDRIEIGRSSSSLQESNVAIARDEIAVTDTDLIDIETTVE